MGEIVIKRRVMSVLLLVAMLVPAASCKPGNLTGISGNSELSQILSSSQGATTGQEKTASFRFAVMADCRGSDNGVNAKAVKKTLESLKKLTPQPLFAVMPGDLVGGAAGYSAEKSQLQYFKSIILKYYPIGFFYPGFGNHEATAGAKGVQAFEDVFSEFQANFEEGYHKTVYWFEKNNARFYMLNPDNPGESHRISDAQLNFVKANSAKPGQYNFYFFHEPAYPTGSHVGSSLDSDRLQRDKLWEIIDNSENPMVFCGHEHNYTRRHINADFNETAGGRAFTFKNTVYQVTAGTFGAPGYTKYTSKKNVDIPPVAEFHFAVVDVSESKAAVTVYNLNGKVLDRFEQQ